MGGFCCVVGCTRRGVCHRWPLDKQLAKKWFKAVPRKWVIKPMDKDAKGKLFRPYVCRDHFTEDDFVKKTYYSECLNCHFLSEGVATVVGYCSISSLTASVLYCKRIQY